MDVYWCYALLALMPVAAWSGWLAARNNTHRFEHENAIHPDYLKGLNYVLNEQPDKAIEVFIKMVEIDAQTIETHLALGNLFRRRGEVDRAIRIHQNLIARPTLTGTQRQLAVLELAMDYMRSGLLDRAEGLFNELLEFNGYTDWGYTDRALEGLLAIYQQEQEWQKAILVARRLQSGTVGSYNAIIAQFYCEQAEQLTTAGQMREAKDMLKHALNTDPGCVRASLMEGYAAEQKGNISQAIKAYRRVEKQAPDYLGEIIEPLYRCYQQLGKPAEFKGYVEGLYRRHGADPLLLALTQLYDELDGEQPALEFISAELATRPTVAGVDRLLGYIIKASEGVGRRNLETIKKLTGHLLSHRPLYQCSRCGFDMKVLHWHCPGCKHWNTIKPIPEMACG